MKSCAFAGLALEPDSPAVRVDCRFCDRHAETGSMLLTIGHERLEYSTSDQFRNTWSIIGDGNVQLRSSITNMDRDRSFIPKSLLCILNDIRKTTSQARLVQRQLAGLINPDNESYLTISDLV